MNTHVLTHTYTHTETYVALRVYALTAGKPEIGGSLGLDGEPAQLTQEIYAQ